MTELIPLAADEAVGLPPLGLEGYSAFFTELWTRKDGDLGSGPTPFLWQTELVSQLAARRRWPDLVDLPTGTGKTSLIDIVLFLLAHQADLPDEQRWMPRRIVLVVDRRVVVDQTDERARHIAEQLADAPPGSVLATVADRLRHLFDGAADAPPLLTSVLRGGIIRDESWARRPDVPAVLSSTVDQVGSRLLFRGYGISPGMRPIHAGLLGNDTLFLLDEVHLSRPFAGTLRQLAHYRDWRTGPHQVRLPDRWQVVELTATPTENPNLRPGGRERWRFPSDELDRDQHEVLRRRLSARKPARLATVTVPRDDRPAADAEFAQHAATEAWRMLAEHPHVRTLGVIVNRVDVARQIADLLSSDPLTPNAVSTAPNEPAAHHVEIREETYATEPSPAVELGRVEVLLLTGRMRPYDRDRLLAQHQPRLRTGRTRGPHDTPLVVVATQALEAGADFDLDGLITECASIDALRQRFGRVDRDGQLSQAGTPAPGLILARSTDVTGGVSGPGDPVYGHALRATWEWLSQRRNLDFGLNLLRVPNTLLSGLTPPARQAPVMLPAHLDAWVQTSPIPDPDPDVARWLHGDLEPDLDVQVVWRADLTETLLRAAYAETAADRKEQPGDRRPRGTPGGSLVDAVSDRIAACPPVSGEAMTVPRYVVERWLRGEDPPSFSDADAASTQQDTRPGHHGWARPWVRWQAGSAEVRVPGRRGTGRPRAGDVVVVPAEYGGIGLHHTWDPTATTPVVDRAAECIALQRRIATIRAIPAVWPGLQEFPDLAVYDDADYDERVETLRDWLTKATASLTTQNPDLARVLDHLTTALGRSTTREGARQALGRMTIDIVRGPSTASPGERGASSTPRSERGSRPGGARGAGAADRDAFDLSLIITAKRQMPHPTPRVGRRTAEGTTLDADATSNDALSFTGAAHVLLEDHLPAVGKTARQFSTRLRQPDNITDDLHLAGCLHDLGKADRRFQIWLLDGHEGDVDPVHPLAKSPIQQTRARRRQARQISGYPDGTRHELLSVEMATASGVLDQAHDLDLVLHLVASHHGYCRPFPPLVWDDARQVVEFQTTGQIYKGHTDHGLERLNSGIPDRFWTLVRRYGWYGAAWLEATLRLADHHQSEQEQTKSAPPAQQADGEGSDGQR